MTKLDETKGFIRDLADMLTQSDLSEIEVEGADIRIRVSRTIHAQVSVPAPAPAVAPAPAPAAAPQAAAEAPAPAPVNLADHPGAVTAPMVGTAYGSPDPGSSPFIRVGDQVSAGDPLLIVEAMKVMNEIKAPKDGRVAQILFENAQPVEFGEVLVILE
ncbi:acetyl-CoA carboxylase, biotin carboxyl carrier protein [Rhodothalassium salexigens]|nr:acetyl-CoA carboxylase biotin carboxyl carrier protein [Rhodothalassium salexigens]MBK5910286.1 acetyl-CoA carboxylase, biotin carboxyl carrier protein [Rhodothalassium salexigens]MBK5921506.1 acetyl-CoA carboxylase, biotin carboxyl carrier protein [Rhodothalassium salexigens]